MKRTVVILLVVSLMLIVSATVAFAGDDGKGDPQPKVGYRPIDTDCGVPAGDWGFFTTADWWWAVYSNGNGVLKCITHLSPDQTPPAERVNIPVAGCGTPVGTTDDAWTTVFPDGSVHLICRVR